MKLFTRLKEYILPKDVDFIGQLAQQCALTEKVVHELHHRYILKSEDKGEIMNLVAEVRGMRKKNLEELSQVLITPVDKEAISRIVINLHWVTLSVEHLQVEIDTYGIHQLDEYAGIFGLLNKQMAEISASFELIREKRYELVFKKIDQVIQYDDELILEYAIQLSQLFTGNNIQHILQHKEILSQLKEISKRIHVCANSVEDMVFKMN